MVAEGRQRTLIPQGIRDYYYATTSPRQWGDRRASASSLSAPGGGGTDRSASSGGGFLRFRSRKHKIAVILGAHCLAAVAFGLLWDDDGSEMTASLNPFRQVHRALCRDYLHAQPQAVAVPTAAVAGLSQQDVAAAARSLAAAAPSSPGVHRIDNVRPWTPADLAARAYEIHRQRLARRRSRSDASLFRRMLSCDVGFNNCTDGDPSCIPSDPEEDNYDRYPPTTHTADPDKELPSGGDNVAYVMPIKQCPPHPQIQETGTTGEAVDSSTFYDAFAVTKSTVCNCTKESVVPIEGGGEAPASNYNYTMYAVLHSDAQTCVGSDGSSYDLAKTLEEQGFWVRIFDEPVYANEVQTNAPDVAANYDFRETVMLHAYRLTNHPIAYIIDPTVVMLKPLDNLYDSLLGDPAVQGAYSKPADANGFEQNVVDLTTLVIKPSVDEFEAIKTRFKTATYDPATGWGGTGIGAGGLGFGFSSFLMYDYTFKNMFEIDRCTYNNGNDPSCKSTDFDSVYIARTSDLCGQPWDCTFDTTGMDAETEQMCRAILYEWSRKRADFEDNHWEKPNTVTRDGTYYMDVYLGYCDGSGGKTGYKQMTSFETVALPEPTPAPVPTTPVPTRAPQTAAPVTPVPTRAPQTDAPVPAPSPDDIPYIPVPAVLQVTCPVMDCGPGSYVKSDCTCTPLDDPCQACPKDDVFGTRCQYDPNDNSVVLMCIDCTCGFCNYENTPCCNFNGVNNCKSATNDNECLLQNGFFGPFDGTGSSCSGVEISYTATPNGCGCQPSQTEPCTYDPNERTMDEQCYICSADDLVVAASSADDCWDCKVCLNNCESCIGASTDVLSMEACLSSQAMNKKNKNPECREGCAPVCGK